MKKYILTVVVLVSMLLGMVSSASSASMSSAPEVQQAAQKQADSVIARVYFTSQDQLNKLAARYDVLQVDKAQGFAYVILTPEEFTALQQAGYRVEVDENKTRLLNLPFETLPGQGPDSIPGFPCYRTVEETYSTMEQLANNNVGMAKLFDIGDSWDKVTAGGNPGFDMLALRLTNEDPQYGDLDSKPTMFLMAEIHARELATAETATRFAEFLINNYGTNPDITWLLDYFRIYIVTMTNPDGRKIAETGEWWRKNVDNDDGCSDPGSWGTDLNRNHSFKWAYDDWGSDPWPCGETYRGPSAASEPETQAIQDLVLTLFPDQRGPGDTDPAPPDTTGVLISLHSAAALVLWPWGWTGTDAPNALQLQTLGRHLAYYNSYTPQQSNDLYATNGTSDDWSYGTLGIASYTFEMAGEFFQPCSPFENTDWPDNRDALFYGFKSARLPYMNPSGPDTENVIATPAAAEPGDPVLIKATANDTHYASGEPTQNIAEAHYSIDKPAWLADTFEMSPSDGAFDEKIEDVEATIDTTGLTSGRHTIFVESKDANGNWGVTGATFLYIIEPGVSPVLQGYVREAGSNLPVAATVTAGLFTTTTDPDTGFYSMTVISGTYDMVAEADNFAPAYANGVVADDYQTIDQDFYLYPVCTLFTDDVESGNQDWTADYPWAITNEASHSPTHSWTDSPCGNYSNNRDISLTSQTFDLSDATGVTLSFWQKVQTEAGYDYGSVEYNVGSGWNLVDMYSGYQDWSQAELPIPALDGQANAQIRFHFTSDYYQTDDGWHIDDIQITAGGPGCMPPEAPVAGFSTNSPVLLGQTMVFTNTTTGSQPMTYAWDFGDGIGISTEMNPTYTYAAVGDYDVTLAATNNLGTDVITQSVTVQPSDITTVNLTLVTDGKIYVGDVVDFSADLLPDEAGKPYTYTVDYGDGTVVNGTSSDDPLSLDHTYLSPGTYTVQFSAWNQGMPEPVQDNLDVLVLQKTFLPITDK